MTVKKNYSLWVLLVIVMGAPLLATIIAVRILYDTAFDLRRIHLVDLTENQAILFQELDRYRMSTRQDGLPDNAASDRLEQAIRTHILEEEMGGSVDFLFFARQGDQITHLLETQSNDHDQLESIRYDSPKAALLRRALTSEAGSIISVDSRGKTVLAAFRSIPTAEGGGKAYGMVAKIDLAKIRAPFVRAGFIAGSVSLLLSGSSVGLILLIRRKLMIRLGQSEVWSRAIVDHAASGIVTIDERGKVDTFNIAAEKMFGFTADEVIGQNVTMLMPSPDREHHDDYVSRYLHGGDAKVIGFTREVSALNRRGEIFPIQLHVSEVWLGSRRIFAAMIEDISHQKRSEEQKYIMNARLRDTLSNQEKLSRELESAMHAAEEASRAKSDFLANMSHEIRTPMTAILGFAEVLLEEENLAHASPVRIDAARTIRRNGEHLLSIINDILDLSKIESGKMTIEHIECSPVQIVQEVRDLMRVRADARDLVLEAEFIGAVPESIRTDLSRLRQILINMIGNAIKFTENGGVRLIARLLPHAQHPRMQFDVIDTGVGMSEEQVAILFQPFVQADTSTSRKYGGTGLGLTICKRFAQMLGGDIEIVDTNPGRGTRFRVTINVGSLEGIKMIDPSHQVASAVPAETSSVSSSSPLQDCRILLAEDGPDNQRLISFLLKKAGAEVTVEENGKLALEAALAARENGRPFAVILMDMQMPVMGGYEATTRLRRAGYTQPIIALTAHAMAEDREKCLNAGCDDYATKPIDKNTLLEIITRWTADKSVQHGDGIRVKVAHGG